MAEKGVKKECKGVKKSPKRVKNDERKASDRKSVV